MITTRFAPALGAALLAAGLALSATPASAAVSDGDAIGICKQKVKETYGETGNLKLKKLKKRDTVKVDLVVYGAAAEPFTAKCEIARDGTLKSFSADAPAK